MCWWTMNLATNLFIVYFVYTLITYIKLALNKNMRKEHQNTQKGLEKLRDIPFKTLEQQKKFLNLKYPTSTPFIWSWSNVGKVVLKLGTMIFLFLTARYLWKTYIIWEFSLWHVIIIMVVFPIILNKILKKFNLQQDDILLFIK